MKVVLIVIFILLYILLGFFLNKFNVLMGNKKTIIAYIPLMNIYLLGKLAVDDFFGIAMALYFIVANGTYSITLDSISINGSFLSGNFGLIMKIIYDVLLLIVIIYALYKYFYMKNKFNNPLILTKKDKNDNKNIKKESKPKKVERKDNRKDFSIDNDSFFNPFK